MPYQPLSNHMLIMMYSMVFMLYSAHYAPFLDAQQANDGYDE